jgi:hypothetical protein
MNDWYQSAEFEMPLWVRDLDDKVYSVGHRRLCVWPDEFEANWHWEIQTYEDAGVAASGICAGQQDAMATAEAAARSLAAAAAGGCHGG